MELPCHSPKGGRRGRLNTLTEKIRVLQAGSQKKGRNINMTVKRQSYVCESETNPIHGTDEMIVHQGVKVSGCK